MQKNEFRKLYKKIYDYIYPQLRRNPYFGHNIKKLKGDYADIYRYRIGNHRLFYTIEESKVTVFILDIADRKDAYKKK